MGFFSTCIYCGKFALEQDRLTTKNNKKYVCKDCCVKYLLAMNDDLTKWVASRTPTEIINTFHDIEKNTDENNKIQRLDIMSEHNQKLYNNYLKYQKILKEVQNDGGKQYGRYIIDEKKEIILQTLTPKDNHYRIIPFLNICITFPLVDAHYKFERHTVGRSIVGGLLGGEAGAIIGGTTGGKNRRIYDRIGFTVELRGEAAERIEIIIFHKTMLNGGLLSNKTYKEYKHLEALFRKIENHNSNYWAKKAAARKQNAQKNRNIDPADEIAKFKKLLDAGAITQEEYDAKKKQLLKL